MFKLNNGKDVSIDEATVIYHRFEHRYNADIKNNMLLEMNHLFSFLYDHATLQDQDLI